MFDKLSTASFFGRKAEPANVQIFNNTEFGEIRTVIKDSEVWFCGRDVAMALGYKKPETSVRDRVRDKDTEKFGILTSGGEQNMIFINESGLYRLIFGSKLESAERFQDWVFDEVLPSIRKTGSYNMPTTPQGQIQLLAQGYVEMQKQIDTVSDTVEAVKSDFNDFKEDCPLFPVDMDRISRTARKKGVEVMGGKSSIAYHDRSIVQMVYRDIYGEIHRNFGCRSYKEIARKNIDKAIEVIENYTLPMYLTEKIEQSNR